MLVMVTTAEIANLLMKSSKGKINSASFAMSPQTAKFMITLYLINVKMHYFVCTYIKDKHSIG